MLAAVSLALAGGEVGCCGGIPFSISAAVGFIAMSVVEVPNELVLVSAIRKRLEDGVHLTWPWSKVPWSACDRLLMTALVASLDFVPMAIATGTRAEVQNSLATVAIGGAVIATALTLLVLPALCGMVGAALTAKHSVGPQGGSGGLMLGSSLYPRSGQPDSTL